MGIEQLRNVLVHKNFVTIGDDLHVLALELWVEVFVRVLLVAVFHSVAQDLFSLADFRHE